MPIPFLRCAFATSQLVAVFATLAFPVGAEASTLIDRNAQGVDAEGRREGSGARLLHGARQTLERARVGRRQRRSRRRPAARQVEFKIDYSGGWGTYKKDVWKTLENTCGPYRARRSPGG